ncbi:MAG: AI-2E family transporter [Pyrinomonadaceae bacterium]
MAEKETREKKHTARRVFLDPSTPSVLTIVRVVIITLVLIAIFDFAKTILASLTYLFFMIVLAIFFAYLIEPLVKMIRRPFKERGLDKLMPRSLAIGVSYILVFSVLGLAIAYAAPLISNQAKAFGTNITSTSIQEQISGLNRRLDRMRISDDIQTKINEKISEFGEYIASLIGTTAIVVATYLPWLILVPILAFFFLKDANLFRVGILRIFPSGRWRARMESVLFDINTTLAAYTRAQMISCFLIGLICTIGFYALGNNYALLLGILAGVFEFIPLIGPVTIGILATFVAGFESGYQALSTGIFLAILRILQDYVLYPRIIREGIHLHPLAIILSVLAGEQVAGIPGVFLSIPIVALLTVIYKHVLDHLGSKGLFVGLLEPKENVERVKSE